MASDNPLLQNQFLKHAIAACAHVLAKGNAHVWQLGVIREHNALQLTKLIRPLSEASKPSRFRSMTNKPRFPFQKPYVRRPTSVSIAQSGIQLSSSNHIDIARAIETLEDDVTSQSRVSIAVSATRRAEKEARISERRAAIGLGPMRFNARVTTSRLSGLWPAAPVRPPRPTEVPRTMNFLSHPLNNPLSSGVAAAAATAATGAAARASDYWSIPIIRMAPVEAAVADAEAEAEAAATKPKRTRTRFRISKKRRPPTGAGPPPTVVERKKLHTDAPTTPLPPPSPTPTSIAPAEVAAAASTSESRKAKPKARERERGGRAWQRCEATSSDDDDDIPVIRFGHSISQPAATASSTATAAIAVATATAC